ncbi:MAG: 5'-nucleotidase C-terminal domain-containing protein, partial [Atribacterota bacterium]
TVLFNLPVPGARAAVAELEKQGINKIMVLSHLGVEEDIKLAQQVSGIDVIVGGHSHTLMGNFSAFAYHTSYSYPLHQKDPDGKDVLIVQAWEWAKVLGKIRLTFDDAGNVVDDQPNPVFIVGEAFDQKWQDTNGDGQVNEKDAYTPVTQENAPDRYRSIVQYINQSGQARIFAEDPPGKQLRDRYCLNVQKLKGTVIAQSPVDLTRNGMNSGPGPLIAAGMLEKTAHMGAQMALLNPGGVRVDIPAGPVSISTVYDLIPFQSTLVLVTLTGQEMENALEDMVDFCLSENGYGAGIYAYVAGVHFSLDLTSPRGQRVFDLKIRQKDGAYQTAQPQETYHLVTLNFLAEGGDKNLTLGKIQNKVDTGFVDADVFMEYIKGKTLQEPSEELVTLSSGD